MYTLNYLHTEISQIDFARKERIVVKLSEARVDVHIQIVRPQEDNLYGLGRTSSQEGEERIEITMTESWMLSLHVHFQNNYYTIYTRL